MPTFRILAAAALLALAIPSRGNAQVGGLINKAKKAVVDDATTKPAGSNAQLGDPFDASTVDAALKGMKVFKARMGEVTTMRTQYLAGQNKRQELADKNARAISEYQANDQKIRDCIAEQVSASETAQRSTMQQKMMAAMSDPAAIQKFSMLSQAVAAASAKGDTAAVNKANSELFKAMGIDPKADTVAAIKRCGAPPPKNAALSEMERLEKQSDTLSLRIRSAETTADIDAARAAGVQPARFAQMRERLTMYVAKPAAFPGKEGDALKARKAEIEDAVKTP